MGEATRSPEETEESEGRSAVSCSRGHLNDPYPSNGQCTECSIFLPANPYVLKSEDMDEINKRKALGGKTREEIARSILEDEGVEWDSATETLRQLALQFAKSKNTKTIELILQQIGVLRAKPRPGEADTVVEYQVILTGASVEALKDSLQDLDDLLRID